MLPAADALSSVIDLLAFIPHHCSAVTFDDVIDLWVWRLLSAQVRTEVGRVSVQRDVENRSCLASRLSEA